MNKQEYYQEKMRHDFEEDMRYESEKELEKNIQYAIKHGLMSEDQGEYLLKNKEEGFKWLFGGHNEIQNDGRNGQ